MPRPAAEAERVQRCGELPRIGEMNEQQVGLADGVGSAWRR
jgi:hypothetical protein